MILLPQDYWEIKNTPQKGRGIFAKKTIKPGVVIGDYIGKVIKTQDADFSDPGLYLMYYHDFASIYPTNLAAPGMHLINHSCSPNCWMYVHCGHTLFFTLRKILKGEELTVSYLLSPKGESCNPCFHKCKCGSINCLGTMHQSEEKYSIWREFCDKQSKETKRKKVRYGKVLPRLKFYPKRILNYKMYRPLLSFSKDGN